jgi:hypothetical protein
MIQSNAVVKTTAAGIFGNVSVTANSLPTNGLFLASSNNLAIATNSAQAVLINNVGCVAVGGSQAYSLLDVYGATTIRGTTAIQNLSGTNTSLSVASIDNSYTSVLVQNSQSTTALTANGAQSELRTNTNTPLVFLTNNTERMRIDNGGNVGIATTGTTVPLTVAGSATASSAVFAGGNTVVRMQSLPGNSYSEPALDFGESTLVATARIASKNIANGGGALIFMNRDTSSLTSALTERMRITPTGQVGIGTSVPGATLQIGSATYAPNSNLTNNLLQIKSPSGYAYFTIGNGDTANSTSFMGGASGYTTFGTVLDNGTLQEWMRIDSTGAVGIGTTSMVGPSSLTVSNTSSAQILARNWVSTGYSGIRLYNDQNSGSRSIEIDYAGSAFASSLLTSGPTGESGSIATTGAYPLSIGTNSTARITILGNGNVGIASTSPVATLDVAGITRFQGYNLYNTYMMTLDYFWHSAGTLTSSKTFTVSTNSPGNNENFGVIVHERSAVYATAIAGRYVVWSIMAKQPGSGATVVTTSVNNVVVGTSGISATVTPVDSGNFTIQFTHLNIYTTTQLHFEAIATSNTPSIS